MKRRFTRSAVAAALGLLALVSVATGGVHGPTERADDASVVVAVPPGWRWGTG